MPARPGLRHPLAPRAKLLAKPAPRKAPTARVGRFVALHPRRPQPVHHGPRRPRCPARPRLV